MEELPKNLEESNNTGGGSSEIESKQKPKLTEEEELNSCVETSRRTLYSLYGIELTNTEYLYLRNIAKESIAREKFTRDNTSLWSMDRFYAEYDIPLLFLEKMYGFSDLEVPKKYMVFVDYPNGEEFSFSDKKDAERKRDELNKEGKNIWFIETAEATDEFKKYLKRMRETRKFEQEFSHL